MWFYRALSLYVGETKEKIKENKLINFNVIELFRTTIAFNNLAGEFPSAFLSRRALPPIPRSHSLSLVYMLGVQGNFADNIMAGRDLAPVRHVKQRASHTLSVEKENVIDRVIRLLCRPLFFAALFERRVKGKNDYTFYVSYYERL